MDIVFYEDYLKRERSKKNTKPKKVVVVKVKYTRKEENSSIDLRRHYDEGQEENNEPEICKHFGCGKKLSPMEQLYGDRCFEHTKKETTLSLIDKHISL